MVFPKCDTEIGTRRAFTCIDYIPGLSFTRIITPGPPKPHLLPGRRTLGCSASHHVMFRLSCLYSGVSRRRLSLRDNIGHRTLCMLMLSQVDVDIVFGPHRPRVAPTSPPIRAPLHAGHHSVQMHENAKKGLRRRVPLGALRCEVRDGIACQRKPDWHCGSSAERRAPVVTLLDSSVRI